MKWKLMLIVIAMIVLSGCAASVGYSLDDPNTHIYGFWGGLWHGMVAPFAWFCNLFGSDFQIYAVNNNSGWYNFGFILGLSGAYGGGSSAAGRSR